MVMHSVDASLGSVHAGDSLREITLILRYIFCSAGLWAI